MIELTDREKKLVMIKFIIHGMSPYQDVPIEIRGQMLEASLKTMGIKYTTSELLDLGEACIDLQEQHKQLQEAKKQVKVDRKEIVRLEKLLEKALRE